MSFLLFIIMSILHIDPSLRAVLWVEAETPLRNITTIHVSHQIPPVTHLLLLKSCRGSNVLRKKKLECKATGLCRRRVLVVEHSLVW